MYAIVEIAGQQFKVEEGKTIFVHRLELEEGKKIDFDKVLLIEEEGKVTIGEPVIKDAFVEGKVIDQVRGDKVIVFKKKRKKGYRIKNGHRQNFTRIEIVSINGKTTRKQVVRKETKEALAEPAGEIKAVEKKTIAKKQVPKKLEAVEKKSTGKKPEKKKPDEKKPETKKSSKGKV